MIRCMKIEQYGKAVNEAVCYLFADTKEEVVDGATIDNMPSGYTLAMGTYVITASGDIAFLNSDLEWVWVGEEDSDSRSVSASVDTRLLKSNPEDKAEPIDEIPEEEEEPKDDMR